MTKDFNLGNFWMTYGYNLVVLKMNLRYDINVVRYLFVDDYIPYKKEEDRGYRIEKCGKSDRYESTV